MIRIRTLGPAAILADGIPPPPELLWRKHLALLIYLACSPRKTRTRQHLLGLLWSDRAESAARHSLNEALRIIRRTAGSDAVVTSVDQVSLTPTAIQLDLDEILAAIGNGDRETAAALVNGEFLEGFGVPGANEFEDWLRSERRVWRARGAEILAHRAVELARAGNSEKGRLAAARATRLDPEAEPIARAAVEVLALAGDVPGALAHYERYRATLADSLDVAPSAEFAALAERLRRLPQPRVRRGATAESDRRRAPLVGRESELERLQGAWAIAAGGRAAVAVVSGDLGTGKSRLVEELVRLTVIEGAVAAVARTVEADHGSPGAGIMALVRDGLLDARGLAGARVEALALFARDLPAWTDRFPAARLASPLALGAAFTDIVESISRESPVVLAIDDAEWCDRESILALEALIRDVHSRPFLLVLAFATYPSRADLERLEARVGHDLPGALILLGPLDAAAIRGLAEWTVPGMDQPALDRLSRRVMAETGGYPLLAVDLLHAIALGVDSTPGAESWPRPAVTLSQSLPGDLPDAVVAAVRVGFRRLSPDAQLVLGAASAGPDRVDPERLTLLLELPADRVDAALDELEWSRWLAADARGYTFRARLIQKIIGRDFTTGSMRRRWLARGGAN
ncbi:MAG: AAA family ATPase [Gemmatimonadota bacterium]